MRRCHEVDIVRALFLQFQKNFFQAFHRNFPSGFSCRNIVVLAKHAPHRAAAKKHCTRTCRARDARFFPVVQRCPCRPAASPSAGSSPICPAIRLTWQLRGQSVQSVSSFSSFSRFSGRDRVPLLSFLIVSTFYFLFLFILIQFHSRE